MNRETIEKEINARLDEPDNQWDGIFNSGYSRGFKDGSQWRINAVWHDARKEEPTYWKLIIRQDIMGDCDLGCGLNNDTVSWAYISDLLPDRKEAAL